jgi:hypothetical protein
MAVGEPGVAALSRAYGQLIEAASRFATGAFELARRHRDDYLRALLPDRRLPLPPPAPLPAIPPGEDSARWLAWFQLVAGWVGQEQAWSAAAYRAIAEEAARGRLTPDALEVSARAYLERRLDAYLADLSDLYSRFLADIMGAAGEWLGPPARAEIKRDARPVVIEVRGPGRSTVVTALWLENGHSDRATVRCRTASSRGFAVTASPSELELDAGASARLGVEVVMPAGPATGPAAGPLLAGWITIRGHGDQDLVAEIHAYIDPSHPGPMGPA